MLFIYLLYNVPWMYEKDKIIRVFTFNWMPNIPTWFFVTLGCIKLIYFKPNKTFSMALAILSIAILHYIHSPYCGQYNYLVSSMCMAIPFYVIGYYARDKIQRMHFSYVVIMLCLIALAIPAYFMGRVDIYTGQYGCSYILYFAVAMVGCMGILGLSKKIGHVQNACVYYISRGSGFIVATHGVICNVLKHHQVSIAFDVVFAALLIVLYYPLVKLIVKRFPFLIGKIRIV